MTQTELADKIGIKQSTLSELETGESAGTTYAARIASALGVSALWLETGKGSREIVGVDEGLGGAGKVFELRAETAEELRLLSVYRLANEREREAINDIVQNMQVLIERRIRADDPQRSE